MEEHALDTFTEVAKKDPLRFLDLGNDIQMALDKVSGDSETARATKNMEHILGTPYGVGEALFNVGTNWAPTAIAAAIKGAKAADTVSDTARGLEVNLRAAKIPAVKSLEPEEYLRHPFLKSWKDSNARWFREHYLDTTKLQKERIDDLFRELKKVDPKRAKRLEKLNDEIVSRLPTKSDILRTYATPEGLDYKLVRSHEAAEDTIVPMLSKAYRSTVFDLGKDAAKDVAKATLIPASAKTAYEMSRPRYENAYKDTDKKGPYGISRPDYSPAKALTKAVLSSILLNADMEDPARYNEDEVDYVYKKVFGEDLFNQAKANGNARQMITELKKGVKQLSPEDKAAILEDFRKNGVFKKPQEK